MNALVSIFTNHPYISTLGTYWFLSAFIGALPAPTAQSHQVYVFAYKFINTLGGNVVRALQSKVESSPNFIAAVNTQNAKMGQEKVVVPLTPEETK